MKKFLMLFAISLSLSFLTKAQQVFKLDYIAKLPVAIKNCGVLYTHDSVKLKQKKYILVADLQNQGLVSINGKLVKLLLKDATTEGQANISVYNGGGYVLIVTSVSDAHDNETGTLQISKGTKSMTIKIHGQSHCDISTQEGNS